MEIEGYPAHTCGGPLRPTRTRGELRCCSCGALVTASREEEKLALGAEGRAQRAAASGKEIERVAGRKQQARSLFAPFEAELLEGGPLRIAGAGSTRARARSRAT